MDMNATRTETEAKMKTTKKIEKLLLQIDKLMIEARHELTAERLRGTMVPDQVETELNIAESHYRRAAQPVYRLVS